MELITNFIGKCCYLERYVKILTSENTIKLYDNKFKWYLVSVVQQNWPGVENHHLCETWIPATVPGLNPVQRAQVSPDSKGELRRTESILRVLSSQSRVLETHESECEIQ